MLIPPASVIETWPAPNHVDPVTRGPANIIMNIALFTIVCLFVSLRVYTRLYISKSFGIDDWLILASVFPAGGFAAMALIVEFRYEWNRHIWDVNFGTLPLGLRLIIVAEVAFAVGTTLTKLSMLTLTHRIIGSSSDTLRRITVGVMIVVAVQGTLFCFLVTFQCRRIADFWTLSFTRQRCISEPANLLAAGIINTITDFLVVSLPIPTVWSLRLPGRQQIVLALLFGAGFMVCITGGVRTVYTYRATISNDKTWAIFPVWLTSSLELYIGIICASIPAAKQFFSRFLPRFLDTSMHLQSQTSLSSRTKSARSSIPKPPSDVELAAPYSNHSPPCEVKDVGTSNTERVLTPSTRFSGFDFSGLDRVGTAQSINEDMDRTHRHHRTDSFARLVTN